MTPLSSLRIFTGENLVDDLQVPLVCPCSRSLLVWLLRGVGESISTLTPSVTCIAPQLCLVSPDNVHDRFPSQSHFVLIRTHSRFKGNQFLMSSRTTRSSARLATDPPPAADSGSPSHPAAGSASSRKRKASSRRDRHSDTPNQPTASSPRRSKRQRTSASHAVPPAGPTAAAPRRAARGHTAMSQPGLVLEGGSSYDWKADVNLLRYRPSSRPSEESKSTTSPPPPRRRSSRNGEIHQMTQRPIYTAMLMVSTS